MNQLPADNTDRNRTNTSLRQMWQTPLVVAAITLVGLIAALVGDGWHDTVSWAGLAVPVGLVAWKWGRG